MNRDAAQTLTRRIAGNILMFVPGLALASSALFKFARVPGVVNQMAASGFADGKLMLVATLELLSAVLFVYPRTRSMGLLVLSSFLGGAISTHVQRGEYAKAGAPFILLCFAWVGTSLLHSEVLWSLNLRRGDTNHFSQIEKQG